MTTVAIGCPIRDRAWIIPSWFDYVAAALRNEAGIIPQFFFVGDVTTDDTFKAIDQACLHHSFSRAVIGIDEEYAPYKRVWDLSRYAHMVTLRNLLLRAVRAWEPDYFWSLDSDILAHPDALSTLLNDLDNTDFDAVGGKTYMSERGRACPSYGMLSPLGGLRRPDSAGCFEVDVIMAVKVMTPAAYAVDYELHRQGEDIGWSIAARAAGLSLGWDGGVCSKHVMDRKHLNRFDDRAGF